MGGGGSKKKDEDSTPNLYDEKRRTNIAKELVETERSYVKSLQILCEVFLQPLKDSAASSNPILTSNEIKDIFGIIEVIVNFHATLLSDLDERMKKWDSSTCMGDIFAKNNAFFKMISTYVNGYNNALMTYYQCKNRNKGFSQFLEKAIASTATMLDVQSYLIMPVQRIPRYVLLLTELVKYSNPKHPGYQSLSESLEGVKRVAEFVNEEKKNAESALKMLQIQENLVGKRARTILEPTRRYYGEGVFTWINSRRKEPRPLHFVDIRRYFLFSDCILLATPEKSFFQSTPDKLKLKIMEPLVAVDIQEDSEQQGPKKSKFDITTTHKVFTVHCDPQVDLDEWIEVFYWIRSGCGPRYEKVNAEAQKRNFSRSNTLDHINPKKLNAKSDTQNDKALKSSTDDIRPTSKAPANSPPTSKATTSPPPPSMPAKAPTPSPPPAKAAPPPTPPAKAAPPPTPPAKTAPPPTPPTPSPAKTAPPPTPPAKPVPPSNPPAKNSPLSKNENSAKSAPPTAPGKLQDSKGKSSELAKPDDAKPPRPTGPPPPKKESSKKPEAPATSSAASQPLERRPSFTASFSALFGMKSDAPPSPTPAPASGPTTSPASPRDAKPPATTTKK